MLQEQTTLPNGAIIQDSNREYYVVESLLGQGGFSAVYRVKERRSKKQLFALKELIDPKPQERRNLSFEAALLMRLNHRSLPRVYQVFANAKLNRIYMLMDYIEGQNLEALRQEQPEQRFSLTLALALLTPIVSAVTYLHSQQLPIIHRDIKPGNIIVPAGASDAFLVDFGLAKEYIEDKTTTVFRYGTPGYAAPEQYGQGTNPRTDVYALAATLYTLLTGTIPIDALTRSVNQPDGEQLKRADQVCATIPPAVGMVIERAMSLRTDNRFASAEKFWQALCIAATQQNIQAPQAMAAPAPLLVSKSSSKPARTARKALSRSKKVVIWGLLALMLIAAAIDGIFLLTLKSHQATIAQNQDLQATRAATLQHTIARPKQPANPCTALVTPTTAVISSYPQLASCYAGTINNRGIATLTKSQKKAAALIVLWAIHQDQGAVTGNFSGLGLTGSFHGQITNGGHLTWDVPFNNLEDTLHFEGDIKTGGEIRFTFGSYNQNGETTQEAYGDGDLSAASQ